VRVREERLFSQPISRALLWTHFFGAKKEARLRERESERAERGEG
jgi:hypothetical protein